MNIRKTILTSFVVLTGTMAFGQENEVSVFNPHWYVQGQIGVQETLGAGDFSKLLAPNAQIAVGYNFFPGLGARIAINSWKSKAGIQLQEGYQPWSWNYIAPAIDLTADLTDLIGGFKPDRIVSAGIFAGIGANIGFNNSEAGQVKNYAEGLGYNVLRNCWDGTKSRVLGRLGATVDFRVSKRVSLGLELQANAVSDKYNSKVSGNADWYFNALVGMKISLGKKSKKVPAPAPAVVFDTVYVDRVVEKVVEKVV